MARKVQALKLRKLHTTSDLGKNGAKLHSYTKRTSKTGVIATNDLYEGI